MAAKKPAKQRLKVDEGSLTLRDLLDFEEYAGVRLSEAFSNGHTPIKAAAALLWVVKRKDNPDFTIDDALDTRIDELEVELVATDPPKGDSAS